MPTDPILSALIHCALFTIDQIRYTFRLIVDVEADWVVLDAQAVLR